MADYASPAWTDERLWDLVRSEDDRAAFAEIYSRYWEPLLNMAGKRLQTLAEAEELVQDVFVSLYLRREGLQLHTSLEAYLKTAMKYQVYKAFRSRAIHDHYVDSVIAATPPEPLRPDTLLEAKQLREQVERVLAQLPENSRSVFVLSRFEQLSHQEIADRLDISTAMVKKHLTKALKLIRAEFKDLQFDLLAVIFFIYTGHF